jgi:hypothetical protein
VGKVGVVGKKVGGVPSWLRGLPRGHERKWSSFWSWCCACACSVG